MTSKDYEQMVSDRLQILCTLNRPATELEETIFREAWKSGVEYARNEDLQPASD